MSRAALDRGSGWFAVGLAIAMFAALLAGERQHSHTIDEMGHMVRGLAAWRAPDTRLSWPHPPLGQMVATALAAGYVEGGEVARGKSWRRGDFRRVTKGFVVRDFPRARALLALSRGTQAAAAAALLLYLWWWSRRVWDVRTANSVALLFAANPLLLAHMGLCTTDFPLAAATLFALTRARDYLALRRTRDALYLGLALGALCAVKLTGIFVAALLAIAALSWAPASRFAGRSWSRRLAGVALDAVILGTLTLLVVNAVYRFHEAGWSVASIAAHPQPFDRLGHVTIPLGPLPDWFRVPLPWPYLYSAGVVKRLAAGAQGGVLIDGRIQTVPYYFPWMLGIKLPLGLLSLCALALPVRVWRDPRRRLDPALALASWVALGFLVLTWDAGLNLGVRHALAVVPCLTLVAGRTAAVIGRGRRAYAGKAVAAAALAGCVAGAVSAYPRFLGDFNLAVGGRAGGHAISVVGEDWGQDLGLLADEIRRRGIDGRVWYSTGASFRVLELEHLGVKVERLACGKRAPATGWTALHVTRWLRQRRCFRHLAGREPDVVLNHHIFLFGPDAER